MLKFLELLPTNKICTIHSGEKHGFWMLGAFAFPVWTIFYLSQTFNDTIYQQINHFTRRLQ